MNNNIRKLPVLPVIIATGFGSGFSPVAPGTAGALLATLIWLALSHFFSFCLVWWIILACILIFTILGIWSANKLEPYWGEDPSRIVVDEMVGVWIPLLAVAQGVTWQVWVAFGLFRVFDIFKPFGIRKMESLRGGVGVMMDDILAGIYSLVIILGIRWVLG